MKTIPINDFETFEKLYNESKDRPNTETDDEKTNMIFLFVASIDPNTNKAWCSDCVEFKPVIDKVMDDYKFNEHLAVATVQVGDKDEWKASDNPYRLHELAITNIPTIVSMKTGQKLVEKDCADPKKVAHLFSNSL